LRGAGSGEGKDLRRKFERARERVVHRHCTGNAERALAVVSGQWSVFVLGFRVGIRFTGLEEFSGGFIGKKLVGGKGEWDQAFGTGGERQSHCSEGRVVRTKF
jgi:hypothetical protein